LLSEISRSLKPNIDRADSGAILPLENFKLPGYETLDRKIAVDCKTAEVILKALAKFYAASLAMKILKFSTVKSDHGSWFTPYKVFEFDANNISLVVDKILRTLQDIDNCKPYIQGVRDAFNMHRIKNVLEFIPTPFATVIHTDA
jgi:hypothetical protein